MVLGLSGGIDSALTAAIAVDALGKESVAGVAMPSRYSSRESLEDARELAENLGIEFRVIPIEEVFTSYLKTLKSSFQGKNPDVTEENIQARIRGNLLMALSNKFGWLVLTTGNKSEMGVGYCTLYGDMAGGFAVIKDVPKTLVYELSAYRNMLESKPVIPLRVMEKAPSAELRPDQKDTDSLPLRGAGPDPSGLRGGRSKPGDDCRPGVQIKDGGGDRREGGSQRIQKTPGSSGDQNHSPCFWPGPPPADHESIPDEKGPKRMQGVRCSRSRPLICRFKQKTGGTCYVNGDGKGRSPQTDRSDAPKCHLGRFDARNICSRGD